MKRNNRFFEISVMPSSETPRCIHEKICFARYFGSPSEEINSSISEMLIESRSALPLSVNIINPYLRLNLAMKNPSVPCTFGSRVSIPSLDESTPTRKSTAVYSADSRRNLKITSSFLMRRTRTFSMMQLSIRLLNVSFNYKTYTVYANYTCGSLQLFKLLKIRAYQWPFYLPLPSWKIAIIFCKEF